MEDLTTVKQGKATTVQHRSEKCLIEEPEILNRWTEYCTELYNHKANGDPKSEKIHKIIYLQEIHSFAYLQFMKCIHLLQEGKKSSTHVVLNNAAIDIV